MTAKTLLQLNTSLFSTGGQSSLLADHFVEAYVARHPDTRVVRRDLAADAVPHLDGERFGAFIAPEAQRTAAQQAVVAYSDSLIEELRAADHLVLGLPMYNFGVPSQLKAYFDHVARAGVTFRYTANGPEGLLIGKKATIFATRGGLYAGTTLDTQTGFVRDFLRFVGISEVEFVYAEGLALGEEPKRLALQSANETLSQLAA